MSQDEHSTTTGFSDRTYVAVWLSLLVLTGVTVSATALHLGAIQVLVAMLIASVKASIVVLYFMNIAKEPLIFRVMLGVAIATLAVIIGLTFVDYYFR
jgi:cytochrome c oxidase subunit IV